MEDKKEFTRQDMIEFASWHSEFDIDDISLDQYLETKKQKQDQEYQMYLALHAKYGNITAGKEVEKSTRELAFEWWHKLPNNYTGISKGGLAHKHGFGNKRSHYDLTGREIEEIWKNEIQVKELRDSYHNAEYLKPNQKQIADEIIDLVGENQFKEIIKESEKRVNQKQYSQDEVDALLDQQAARTTAQLLNNAKEFTHESFKAYIDKFSDEDKLKALIIIADALGYNTYTYLAQGVIDLRQRIK